MDASNLVDRGRRDLGRSHRRPGAPGHAAEGDRRVRTYRGPQADVFGESWRLDRQSPAAEVEERRAPIGTTCWNQALRLDFTLKRPARASPYPCVPSATIATCCWCSFRWRSPGLPGELAQIQENLASYQNATRRRWRSRWDLRRTQGVGEPERLHPAAAVGLLAARGGLVGLRRVQRRQRLPQPRDVRRRPGWRHQVRGAEVTRRDARPSGSGLPTHSARAGADGFFVTRFGV